MTLLFAQTSLLKCLPLESLNACLMGGLEVERFSLRISLLVRMPRSQHCVTVTLDYWSSVLRLMDLKVFLLSFCFSALVLDCVTPISGTFVKASARFTL